MFRICNLLLGLALCLAGSTQANAAFMFTANLSGSQEVPPNMSSASGFATLILNEAQTALTYDITVFGLDFTGSQTAATGDNLVAGHIHRAPFGVNGPVVFGFFGSPFNDNNPNDVVVTPFATGVGGRITGKWDLNEGNGTTTLAAELPNLFAERLYLNLHTSQFPGGEIRGQVFQAPVPASMLLFGLGSVGLVGFRRFRGISG